MQHAGGTFEQVGSAAKRIGILKDDPTLYKPLKVHCGLPLSPLNEENIERVLILSADLPGSSCGGLTGRIRKAAANLE